VFNDLFITQFADSFFWGRRVGKPILVALGLISAASLRFYGNQAATFPEVCGDSSDSPPGRDTDGLVFSVLDSLLRSFPAH
jgi:hypothetical protein